MSKEREQGRKQRVNGVGGVVNQLMSLGTRKRHINRVETCEDSGLANRHCRFEE
jgi:hypothetical protein